MDPDQFDALVARLTIGSTRRETLKGIVGGTIGSIVWSPEATGGRRKRRRIRNDRRQNDSGERRGEEDRQGTKEIPGAGGGANRKIGRRKRKRMRRDRARDKARAKSQQNDAVKKLRKRCKDNGKPCVRHETCCSDFCNQQSGQCSRRPDS